MTVSRHGHPVSSVPSVPGRPRLSLASDPYSRRIVRNPYPVKLFGQPGRARAPSPIASGSCNPARRADCVIFSVD